MKNNLYFTITISVILILVLDKSIINSFKDGLFKIEKA